MSESIPLWAAALVLEGAVERGYPLSALLARAGISTPAEDEPQTPIPMVHFASLLRRLGREMRDEFVGLWASAAPVGTFATVMEQALHCTTLADALRLSIRLYRLIAPGFPLRLRVKDDWAWIYAENRSDTPSPTQLAFQCTAVYWTLSTARWLVERPIEVRHACMSSPAQDARYQEPEPFFEVHACYGQQFTGVAFDAQCLQYPIAHTVDGLKTFLSTVPVNLLRRHQTRVSFTEQVRAQLYEQFHDAPPTLESVAQALTVSVRSLRRWLDSEGSNFQALKDGVRCDVATAWLTHSDLPISEIGARLGFSEASTFHRAFRRWTGTSPGEVRRNSHYSVQPRPQSRSKQMHRWSSGTLG